MLSDLMNITVECADAKVAAESLSIREQVSQKELKALRDQIDGMERVYGRDYGKARDSSTAVEGIIRDIPEERHQEAPRQLGINTVLTQSGDNTEPLLLEIFRLTASLDTKEEKIQHLQQKLLEARTGADAAAVGVGGVGGRAIESSPISDVDQSPYKELFVNSEAEMMRLKVRQSKECHYTVLNVFYSS